MAEHHGAEHDVFRQAIGFGFDHEHRISGTGNDQLQARGLQLFAARVQQIGTVAVAHAHATDRACERHARQGQRSRGTEHRGDVSIDIRIERDDRGHDLNFIEEAVGEQRTDRAVDEARGQSLFLARATFTTEEAAGNAAGRISLFLVIDRQREEILTRLRLFAGDCSHQNDGVTHGNDHGTIGLAGQLAGLDRYRMRTKGERLLGDAHALITSEIVFQRTDSAGKNKGRPVMRDWAAWIRISGEDPAARPLLDISAAKST